MKRDIAIDYLRSSVTVSVVAHHAALAYNTFSHYDPSNYIKSTAPVVDTVRFAPLDCLVAWNDLFFMSLMFLVSGLFVAPSIARKGAGSFLADRAKRLGIPFLIAAGLLSPIAYYPSWLLSSYASQGNFLVRFFTIDGWSSGPAWFIWVLLAFCFVAASGYKFIPNLMKKLSWSARSPCNLVLGFLVVSLISIIPLNLSSIAPENFSRLAGPLYFPTSRSLLYFAFFILGIMLGSANQERSLSRGNLRPWPLWLTIGAFGYAAHALFSSGEYLKCTPAWVIRIILAAAFSFCCAFTCLASLGLARSFFRTSRSVADNFSENAYGVYIFHYPFVIWLQFLLLGQPMPAAMKFFVTFSVALLSSWLLTALLRKTAARRVF